MCFDRKKIRTRLIVYQFWLYIRSKTIKTHLAAEEDLQMVYGKNEAKKKLEVPKEKNEAFLVSVEKLEKVLTIKSYAAAARYARRQETKITENIANFVNINLQESLKNWKHITIIS